MFGSLQVWPFSGALSYGNRTVMNEKNENQSNEEKMSEEQPRNILLKLLSSAHTTRHIHATAPTTLSRLFVVSRFSPFKRFAPKAPPPLFSQIIVSLA